MKRKKFIFVFAAVMAFGFVSCNNNDCVIPKDTNNDQAFVLATHRTNLADGVDSIQVITTGHSLFEEFVLLYDAVSGRSNSTNNAVSLRNSAVLGDIAIFHYENNKKALLVENERSNVVYAYIVETDTRDFFNVFAISIIDSADLYNNNEFDELELDENGRRWGTCMRGAMGILFNDWDDDPVGTFACWMFAKVCVAGAGIACTLQSAGIEPLPREIIDNNTIEIQQITVVVDMSAINATPVIF